MADRYNITGVFAGIGGMELGLHRYGHSTTLFCEADPEACAVLSARFPGVPLNFDVRDTARLAAEIDPNSNLLTAGFPCTDLSQVGRTRGFEGPQSGLIRKVIDLLDARGFPNVLIENVPNWRSLHGGRYMAEVVGALERRGYRWAYRIIDSRAFGRPQRRLRIFLFASRERDPRPVLFRGNETPHYPKRVLHEAAHGFYWTEGNTGLGWGEDCVPPLKGGSAVGIPAAPAILLQDGGVITPDILDGERLQGFEHEGGWTNVETTLPEHGVRPFNQRRRWRLVGNAVNVDVSAWIGEGLARTESWDGPPGGDPLGDDDRWPAAAWFDGAKRHRVELSSWPVSGRSVPLADFLKYPGAPLSRRATEGFYNRICASRLRIAPEFKSAVGRHLDHLASLEKVHLLAAAE